MADVDNVQEVDEGVGDFDADPEVSLDENVDGDTSTTGQDEAGIEDPVSMTFIAARL